MADDYYELLGVPPSASEDELKRAYRRLARELHPDTNSDPQATERFKQITVAYETLRDPERRRRYDMFGPDGERATAGAGFQSDIFSAGLGDLFESFFGGSPFGGGGRRPRSGPITGPDMEAMVDLDFRQAIFGCQQEVKVRTPVVCATCSGSGARPGTQPTACSQCGGTGEMRVVRQSILGQMVTASPCRRCSGMGREIRDPCPDCRGEGRRTEERTYTVEVPGGVDSGVTLRVPGRGGAGPRGGPPGDLLVHIRVRSDDRFQRQGSDLVHVLHVSMTQAALGATVALETLDDTQELTIPRGTQTGRTFRLRGLGVPNVGGRGRGDLIVQVVVDTPTDLTKEQDETLRLLAAERGEDVAPPDTSLRSRIRSAFK